MLTKPHTLAATGDAVPVLHFRVEGTPRPQGSLRAFGFQRADRTLGARVTTDNPELYAWRLAVARAARAAIPAGRTTYRGAVEVIAEFALRRPRRVREAMPTARPDIDKLARGILDALTGIVWRDDAQVVCLTATKRYSGIAEQPHAAILITPVRPTEPRMSWDAADVD